VGKIVRNIFQGFPCDNKMGDPFELPTFFYEPYGHEALCFSYNALTALVLCHGASNLPVTPIVENAISI
jgi:hypothetical protein